MVSWLCGVDSGGGFGRNLVTSTILKVGMHKIILLSILILVMVSCTKSEKPPFSGEFKTGNLRSLWSQCFRGGMATGKVHPILMNQACDCWTDKVRAELHPDNMSESENEVVINKMRDYTRSCLDEMGAMMFPPTEGDDTFNPEKKLSI